MSAARGRLTCSVCVRLGWFYTTPATLATLRKVIAAGGGWGRPPARAIGRRSSRRVDLCPSCLYASRGLLDRAGYSGYVPADRAEVRYWLDRWAQWQDVERERDAA